MTTTPTNTPENPLIFERLAAVMAKVEAIGKGQQNRDQGFAFRGIDDVMNELHGKFAEQQIVIIPEVTDHQMEEVISKKGAKGYHHITHVTFRLTTVDGSSVCLRTIGESMDYGDKGATKTLSVALKYALLQCLLIPTADTPDPDSRSHEIAATPAKPEPDSWEAFEIKGKTLKERVEAGEGEYLAKCHDYYQNKFKDAEDAEKTEFWSKRVQWVAQALSAIQDAEEAANSKELGMAPPPPPQPEEPANAVDDDNVPF